MLALVKEREGLENLVLKECPVPDYAENEVLIRVTFGGICGTDLHIYHDQYPYYPPVSLGHEFSGEIVAVGDKVNQFVIGDKVVGEPHNKACGKCHPYRHTGASKKRPVKR